MNEIPTMMLAALNSSRIRTRPKPETVSLASSKMEETASVASPKLSRMDSELLKCLDKEHSDEQVLKQYSCSWQKESYLPFQGHLYITANFICFYSSFLGREAKIAVKCRDIVTLYKQKTAFVFPNAITISTADKKYTLTSFMSRNHAFRAIQCVWQNSLKRNPLSSERLLKMLKSPGSSRRMLRRGSSGSSGDKIEDGDATTESSEPESISDVPPNQAAFEVPPAAGCSNNHIMIQSQSSTSGSTDPPSFSEGPSESLGQEDLSSLSLLSEEVDGTGYGGGSSSSDRHPLAAERKPEPDRQRERSKEPETFTEGSPDTQTKPLSKRTLKEEESSLSGLIDLSDNVEVDGGPHKGRATVKLASVDSRSRWWNVWTKCQQLRSWLPVDMFTSSLCTIAAIVLIFVFLLCSLALLCELSLVDPTLQAWLGWQPWCAGHNASHTPVPHTSAILTKSIFKEMVAKYHMENPSLATSSSQESVPVDSVSEPQASPSVHHTI